MLSSVYICCIVDYLFGVLHFANYAPECGIGIYSHPSDDPVTNSVS